MKLPLSKLSGLTGIKRDWHGNNAMGADDEFTISTSQDVTGILELCQAERHATDGSRFNDHMTMAGKIPITVHARIVRQARKECDELGESVEERSSLLMYQWLEANPKFKTFSGTHSFR